MVGGVCNAEAPTIFLFDPSRKDLIGEYKQTRLALAPVDDPYLGYTRGRPLGCDNKN